MSIKYVILGYLSWQPMTGYDVKKIIADSETLPWTGNNNQIYRALVQLHTDAWVSKSIEEQDGAPNRHIYTITEEGIRALGEWVKTEPEVPQSKKTFLHQLRWADSLEAEEIDELLEAYLNTVGEKLFFLRVQADRKPNMPDRSMREKYLWEMIHKNGIAQYETELDWIRRIREELKELEAARRWTKL
ncbi:MAG: PadR family transcriptional regulator [Anaerolineae bacterium]|nr:PadR family transcriptional regulator [Anaerolineae bacterium]MBT7069607.1 PadR family transcriptional regulator [Anaerolineae bacterium]MBT7324526.1 PadR family transcriptional regulator [Anaerolineae bacterium]